MKTFFGTAINDHTLEIDGGGLLQIRRGEQYILSHEHPEHPGYRFIFSNGWGWVPAEWFTNIRPGYGHGLRAVA